MELLDRLDSQLLIGRFKISRTNKAGKWTCCYDAGCPWTLKLDFGQVDKESGFPPERL
jgi:hypothetical protein